MFRPLVTGWMHQKVEVDPTTDDVRGERAPRADLRAAAAVAILFMLGGCLRLEFDEMTPWN